MQTFQRQRECTDEFIPALVALRVKHDLPAGIAAADARDGRPALVASARAEWQEDSKDPAIEETCSKLVSSMPEQAGPMTDSSRRCLSQTTCAGFVECLSPVIEQHLR